MHAPPGGKKKKQLGVKKQRLKSPAPLARLWEAERIHERTTDRLTLEKSFQRFAQMCVTRGCFFPVLPYHFEILK